MSRLRAPRMTVPWYPGKPGTKPGAKQKLPRLPHDPLIRFREKFIPDPGTGCWLWIGAVDARGYGAFNPGPSGGPQKAHRYVYESVFGPIPGGLFVCHRCDVPRCVNPFHLFLGTHQDNVTDMMNKGRHATQKLRATVVSTGPRSECLS